MRYVDTSIIVSALVPENQSERATEWLALQPPDSLLISPWVTVELSAALARKVRTGRLSERDRDMALGEYSSAILPGLAIVPIELVHYLTAAQISDHHSAGIRAPDALHLAVASAYGVSLCTFDRRLAMGADSLGYSVELIT
jgi:predicted nucleic acid-binding protein